MHATPDQFEVTDRQTFITLLELMQQELAADPDLWENKTLPGFLAAIGAYASDIQGYYDNRQIHKNADEAAWSTFADILKGARVYE